MIIRPASLQDQTVLFDIVLEQCQRYPQLKPDRDKIKGLLRSTISSAKDLCLVVTQDNQVGGALMAQSGHNLWAQRQFAVVNCWVSKIPGGGAALLRQFRDWVIARPVIRVAGISPDLITDPRVWLLAQRIGFKQYGGAYLLYTRGLHHGTI